MLELKVIKGMHHYTSTGTTIQSVNVPAFIQFINTQLSPLPLIQNLVQEWRKWLEKQLLFFFFKLQLVLFDNCVNSTQNCAGALIKEMGNIQCLHCLSAKWEFLTTELEIMNGHPALIEILKHLRKKI